MIFYRRLQPVKALSFDLDDTLYDNRPIILAAEQAQLDFLFAQFPATEALGRSGWLACKLDVAQQTPALRHDVELWRKHSLAAYLHQAGYSPSECQRGVQDGFATFADARSNFMVSDEVRGILATLAAAVPLVALTNGNVDLTRIGIADYFHHVYHASVDLPAKPANAMFLTAQHNLGLAGQQILHIGDCLTNDVFGAISAGWQSGYLVHGQQPDLNANRPRVLPHVQLSELAQLQALV